MNKKYVFYIYLLTILNACSLDADIQSISRDREIDFEKMNRKEPDFIHGEVVTTSAGHKITGVFGEVSETKKSFNNSQWEIEAVFYE